jgi:hypothetical protein
MAQWLYDVGVAEPGPNAIREIEQKLNRAGQAGWELVTVVASGNVLIHYFRHDGSGGRPRPAWI